MTYDELLFYGGLTAAIIIVLLIAVFLVVFYIGKIKLNHRFDEEYGKLPVPAKGKHKKEG